MKYLKLYEDIDPVISRVYWCVNNDKYRCKKQLQKISCPKSSISDFLFQLDMYDETDLFVGVKTIDYRYVKSYKWEMNHCGSYFIDNGYEYMGPVRLTVEDLEEIEMLKNTDKYNL